ncbi:DUF4377 domain-containing protein [Lampropedia puyangensis]|uniref:DUF4377 domain-containing protein n=1 Tax=Lampropedia puyangensis TaxID=1330072 RepID=A0A4S8F2B8_9BURK|nr:META and DUF4377 domain-containing protein [Lampropedia puyangensis]THU00244.1 DUF4377 domain-containing protein [Lampropedia puyangensis]
MQQKINLFLSVLCCGMLTACATGSGGNAPAAGDTGGRDIFAGTSQPSAQTPFDAAEVLPAFHWQLNAVSGPDQVWFDKNKAALRSPVKLTFHADTHTLSVSGLCNVVNAGYTTTGNAMTLKSGIRTMMACADTRLMDLENRLAEALVGVKTWKSAGTPQAPSLQLTFANGSQWSLEGQPTDATRYGSAAERIFLEIAPQTRSCNDGVRARQCLEVRRVEYDDNGLRKGTGPWQLFYDEIQGFSHQRGERTVLRINRYTRSNPPADASRYVYVLDMRVSTEIAR